MRRRGSVRRLWARRAVPQKSERANYHRTVIFLLYYPQTEKLHMSAVMQKIDEMDVSQKVQVMDYLWSSLESASGEYAPPAWHGHELARRERLYADGKIPVYDWADVKARLQARRDAL